VLGADGRKPEHGHEGRDDQCGTQRLTSFGKSGDERQDRESRHGWDRRDDADPRRIDPDRLQPDRKKRQMGAAQSEQRAVKQCQPSRESPAGLLRCDGDL
jgi:hypothetical protein